MLMKNASTCCWDGSLMINNMHFFFFEDSLMINASICYVDDFLMNNASISYLYLDDSSMINMNLAHIIRLTW